MIDILTGGNISHRVSPLRIQSVGGDNDPIFLRSISPKLLVTSASPAQTITAPAGDVGDLLVLWSSRPTSTTHITNSGDWNRTNIGFSMFAWRIATNTANDDAILTAGFLQSGLYRMMRFGKTISGTFGILGAITNAVSGGSGVINVTARTTNTGIANTYSLSLISANFTHEPDPFPAAPVLSKGSLDSSFDVLFQDADSRLQSPTQRTDFWVGAYGRWEETSINIPAYAAVVSPTITPFPSGAQLRFQVT